MSNRMLRDWTASDRIENLSFQAEVFFTRLIMKADDYGCFHANPKLLRANLFPLKSNVRDTDISRLVAECQKAGLIVIYESDGKKYLEIIEFGQRLRAKTRKYPARSYDGHMSDTCPPEEEEEEEEELEEEGKKKGFAPPAKNEVVELMFEKLDEFSAMGEADKFINFYQSKNWMVGKTKMKDWRAAARGWLARMNDFKNQKNGSSKTNHSAKTVGAYELLERIRASATGKENT